MMKKINFENLNERNNYDLINYLGGIEMEFIKKGQNYLIKDSNGVVVTEEEKIKLENKEMILKDIKANECQQETTKKIKANNEKLKKIKKEAKEIEKTETLEETVDESIKETDTTI